MKLGRGEIAACACKFIKEAYVGLERNHCMSVLNVSRNLFWDSEKLCVSVRLSLSGDLV